MDMLRRVGAAPRVFSISQEIPDPVWAQKHPQHPMLRKLPEASFLQLDGENIQVASITSRSEYGYENVQLEPRHLYVILPGVGRLHLPTITWRRIDLYAYLIQRCHDTFSSCYVEGFYSGGTALKMLFGKEAYPKVSDVDVKIFITTGDLVDPSMIACMVVEFFLSLLVHHYHLPPQCLEAYLSKNDIHTVVYSGVLLATVAIGQDDWTLQFRTRRMHTVAAKSWLIAFDKPYALVLEGSAEEAIEDVSLGRIQTHDPENLRGKGVLSLWDLMTQGWFPATSWLHQCFLKRGEEELIANPTLLLEYGQSHRARDLAGQMALLLTVGFDFYASKRGESILKVILGICACWKEKNEAKVGAVGARFFDTCLQDIGQGWCWLQWHLLFCGKEVLQAVPRKHTPGDATFLCHQGYGYYPLRHLMAEALHFSDAVYLAVQENFELLWETVYSTPNSVWSSLGLLPSSEDVESLAKSLKTGDDACLWSFLFGDWVLTGAFQRQFWGKPSLAKVLQGLEAMKAWMQHAKHPVGGIELKIIALQLLGDAKTKVQALPRFWALLGQVPCAIQEKRGALLSVLQAMAQVAHQEELFPFYGFSEDTAIFEYLYAYYTSSREKQVLAHFSKLKTHHAMLFGQEVPFLIQKLLEGYGTQDLGELLLDHSDSSTKEKLLALEDKKASWEKIAWRLSEGTLEEALVVACALKDKMSLLTASSSLWLLPLLIRLVDVGKSSLAASIGKKAYRRGLLSPQEAWKLVATLQPALESQEFLLVETMCLDLCQKLFDKALFHLPWFSKLLIWSFEHATGSKLLLWVQMPDEIFLTFGSAFSPIVLASFYARCAGLQEISSSQLERVGAVFLAHGMEEKKAEESSSLLKSLWKGGEARGDVDKARIAKPLFDKWQASLDLSFEVDILWLKLAWECGRKSLIPAASAWRRRRRFALLFVQAVMWCALDTCGLDLIELEECLLWVMMNLADPKERQMLPFAENLWWAERALQSAKKLPGVQLQGWCQEILGDPGWQKMDSQESVSTWSTFVAEAAEQRWLSQFLGHESCARIFLDTCERFLERLHIKILEDVCMALEHQQLRDGLLKKAQRLRWFYLEKRAHGISRHQCIERLLSVRRLTHFPRGEVSRFCLSLLLKKPLASRWDVEALKLYLDARHPMKEAIVEDAEKIAALLRQAFQLLGQKEEAFALWKLAMHLRTTEVLSCEEMKEIVLRAARGVLEYGPLGVRMMTQGVLLRLKAEHNMPLADYKRYALGHEVYRSLVLLLHNKDVQAAARLRWEIFKSGQHRLFQDVVQVATKASRALDARVCIGIACLALNYLVITLFMSTLHPRHEPSK